MFQEVVASFCVVISECFLNKHCCFLQSISQLAIQTAVIRTGLPPVLVEGGLT